MLFSCEDQWDVQEVCVQELSCNANLLWNALSANLNLIPGVMQIVKKIVAELQRRGYKGE